MNSNLRYLSIKVPGKKKHDGTIIPTPLRIDIRGNFVAFVSAPDGINFSIEDADISIPAVDSLVFKTEGGELFNAVYLQNTTGNDLTVKFYFGIGTLSYFG